MIALEDSLPLQNSINYSTRFNLFILLLVIVVIIIIIIIIIIILFYFFENIVSFYPWLIHRSRRNFFFLFFTEFFHSTIRSIWRRVSICRFHVDVLYTKATIRGGGEDTVRSSLLLLRSCTVVRCIVLFDSKLKTSCPRVIFDICDVRCIGTETVFKKGMKLKSGCKSRVPSAASFHETFAPSKEERSILDSFFFFFFKIPRRVRLEENSFPYFIPNVW